MAGSGGSGIPSSAPSGGGRQSGNSSRWGRPAKGPAMPDVTGQSQAAGSSNPQRGLQYQSGGAPASGRGGGGRGNDHPGFRGGGGGRGARGPKVNFNNPLYQPSATLSGRPLYRAGQALAESEYGPTIHEDRGTMRENARQGAAAEKLTAGYFNQLGRFTHQSMRAERGISQQLSGQLAGIGGQTAGQLGQIGQQALQGVSQYTPQSAPGDNSLAASGLQALAGQLAQQKSLSAQNTTGFRSAGALQGANYRQLAASNLGTFALGGQQELGNIAASTRLANEPLTQQIAALLAKRGALAAADTAKLRQAEITNNLTRQGLGLKSKALQVTAAYDQGRLALSKLDAQIRQNEYAAANRLGWARLSEQKRNDLATKAYHQAEINARLAASHGSGAVKPLTTNENDTQLTLLGTAVATIRSLRKAGKPMGQIVSALEGGNVKHVPRINSAIAQAAAELAESGAITPQTLQALHNLGMHNVTWNGQPIKVLPRKIPKGVNPF